MSRFSTGQGMDYHYLSHSPRAMGFRTIHTSGSFEDGMMKGTWTPEEDQILLEFVEEHGARNWNYLCENGLLKRSGKSCRLRYVNQLQPGLVVSVRFFLLS